MSTQKCVWFLFAVTLVSAPHASAAAISWSAAQNTTAATNVLTTGTLVQAINGTTSIIPATLTVNTVPFTNVTSFGALTSNINGLLNAQTTGDTSFNSLLDTVVFGGGTSNTISVGGGSLVSGNLYAVQIFYTDLRPASGIRVMTYGDNLGSNVQVTGNTSTSGQFGQYMIGTFTANSASQTLFLQTSGFGNVHFNALQVRLIPEPQSISLLMIGLGFMGFLGKVGRFRSVRNR